MTITPQATEKTTLREILKAQFSISELKELVFDLGVDYELFPHAKKQDFVLELVAYFDRRGQLRQLETAVFKLRPSEDLSRLATSRPLRKVQIRVRADEDLLDRTSEQLAEIRSRLGLTEDEIELIESSYF